MIMMRLATFAVIAFTLISSALGASIYNRQLFNDEGTTLTRRDGFMTCSSHNNYAVCVTTHECPNTSGKPSHKAGTYEGNSFCVTDCSCGPPKPNVMKCSSHNNKIVCPTTHVCLSGSGAPTHKAGTYKGNSFCATDCSCSPPPRSPPPTIVNKQRQQSRSRSGSRTGGRR